MKDTVRISTALLALALVLEDAFTVKVAERWSGSDIDDPPSWAR
jgi:hypothetical protein